MLAHIPPSPSSLPNLTSEPSRSVPQRGVAASRSGCRRLLFVSTVHAGTQPSEFASRAMVFGCDRKTGVLPKPGPETWSIVARRAWSAHVRAKSRTRGVRAGNGLRPKLHLDDSQAEALPCPLYFGPRSFPQVGLNHPWAGRRPLLLYRGADSRFEVDWRTLGRRSPASAHVLVMALRQWQEGEAQRSFKVEGDHSRTVIRLTQRPTELDLGKRQGASSGCFQRDGH